MIARETRFASYFGIAAEDFGELAASVVAGTLLLLLLVWTYGSGPQMFKTASRGLLPFLLALFFCGVVVDGLQSAINLGSGSALALGLLEDGGEMFAVSCILWYVLRMHTQSVDFSLFSLLPDVS